jgi:EAL domain-containing protein (putative c-di-GMP-specific phosphodiesterase class I)/ActR/RegA family two-component response regulator
VSQLPPPQKRLLVVEDERIQQMLVTHAVAPMGFAVDAAGDLSSAAAFLRVTQYDAVVLDLSLRESEGISLLRALCEASNDPIVIFLSGLDERVITASLRLATSMGLRVAGMLQKPTSPPALRALLRDAPAHKTRKTSEREAEVGPRTVEELAEALRLGTILPHFQPQVLLRDRRVIGVEALARWPNSTGPETPPEQFVPLAERSDLIVPLTFHIMRAALEACGRWRVHYPNCRVAVNISPLVLADPRLPEAIDRLLHETRLGPGALIAEITESTVIANPLVAAEVLTRLRIKGVELSIDDFGTGHSSLLTLLRLPFSELKIDRSFVSQCETDPEAWKIVRATISMARELGLRVVAEGIETETVLDLLRGAGCEAGQGWLFSRAMPEPELIPWLADFPAVHA